ENVLSVTQADAALGNAELMEIIDRLAEAGVTATRVLGRLVRLQEGDGGPLASEALTVRGDALACEVIAAMAEDADRALVPWGPGGLRLITHVVERAAETERRRVVVPESLTSPVDRM